VFDFQAKRPEADFTISETAASRVVHDRSHAFGSLYLATLSFLLFFSPMAVASVGGLAGILVLFVGMLAIGLGCLAFSTAGFVLACMAMSRARVNRQDMGYAIAGLVVNGFFLAWYAVVVIFITIMLIAGKASEPNPRFQLPNRPSLIDF
jgi:hypothetical protein